MPAPPAGLVTALRTGTATRHLFFYLDHPTGAVRAWDGVGPYVFNGQTYAGVAGFASLEGVSNSSDVQNHSIQLTLNRVPLAAVAGSMQSIKGRVGEIYGAWLDESGAVVASRTLFAGVGDILKTPGITEDEITLQCILRGRMADWSAAPRAFYTLNDQLARFPGDTGFKFMRTLENADVSGWSLNAQSSGGQAQNAGYLNLRDTASGRFIFAIGFGGLFTDSNNVASLMTAANTYAALREITTTATGTINASAGFLSFGGNRVYLDAAGDVRTAGGSQVAPTGQTATARLRVCAAITAAGTAGANSVTEIANFFTTNSFFATVGNLTPSGMVFDNAGGHIFRQGAAGSLRLSGAGTAVTYIEDVAGTAVTVSAGGRLQVGGVDLKVSSTGALVTAANRRVYRSGGAVGTDFLRTWT